MSGWEPIETAPKEDMIQFFAPATGQFIGWWDEHSDYWVTHTRKAEPEGIPGVTHWRPLPDPPEVKP